MRLPSQGPNLNRKPIELEGEHIGQHVANDKDRHGKPANSKSHQRAVDPAAGPPGRYDTGGNGNHDGENERDHHQRQRRLQPLRNEFGHRQTREHGRSKVTLRNVPAPLAEADDERPIEAKTRAYAFDIGWRCLIAGNDNGGITRRDVQQAEYE
jgi:hypothetical protein